MDSAYPPDFLETVLAQRRWVRAIAYCMARDDAEADDLSQEAMLTALENPPRERGALRAWFRRVLTNRAHNARRGGSRRADREKSVARKESLPATSEVVARSEAQRDVVNAVHALPADLRDIVLLRFFEDFKTREIAEQLDLPHGTVRSRLSRAMDLLREDLDVRHGGDRAAWVVAILGVPPEALPPIGWPGPGTTSSLKVAAALVVVGAGLTAVLFESSRSGADSMAGDDEQAVVPGVRKRTRGRPKSVRIESGPATPPERGGAAASPSAGTGEAVAWLSSNATRLATLAPDADLGDLAPLVRAIGDRRIVLLGEQTAMEGTTFEAKVRLVKFLHQRMGFDLLVFDGGLYECREMDRALRLGDESPRVSARRGLIEAWTGSKQLLPLWEYLAEQRRGARPLDVAGFGCRRTGSIRSGIFDELRTVAEGVGFGGSGLEHVTTVLTEAQSGRTMPEWQARKQFVRAAFGEFRGALARPTSGGVRAGAEERAFWGQLARSLLAEVEAIAVGDPAERARLRAAQAAENLAWWARERHPDGKLIVWTSTDRVVDRAEPGGQRLRDELGEATYAIGFVAGEGQGGFPWGGPTASLPPPEPGSFGALCLAAGLDNAFVDLCGLPQGHALRLPLVARPIGNRPMLATWPDRLDALVFLRTRTPNAPAGSVTRSDPTASHALLDEVLHELQTIRAGEEGGTVWATKYHLGDVWERWLETNEPRAAEIEDSERQIELWWSRTRQPASMEWRVHDLLALMAARRGDAYLALARFDAGIAAYPDTPLDDPAAHSGFQHLVNRAAFVRAREDGSRRAWDWATRLLETDARFQFFYVGDWRPRVLPRRYPQLLAAVAQAYRNRLAAFPAERERIERAIAGIERKLREEQGEDQ